MLAFAYLALLIALSIALTAWRVSNFRKLGGGR